MLSYIQNTYLSNSAKNGNLKKAKAALLLGADINARTNGWTAWMQAASNGHEDIATFLENQGAEVTESDRINAEIRAKMNKICNVVSGSATGHMARMINHAKN